MTFRSLKRTRKSKAVQPHNSSIREVKVNGLPVQSQPGLHREILTQNKKNTLPRYPENLCICPQHTHSWLGAAFPLPCCGSSETTVNPPRSPLSTGSHEAWLGGFHEAWLGLNPEAELRSLAFPRLTQSESMIRFALLGKHVYTNKMDR